MDTGETRVNELQIDVDDKPREDGNYRVRLVRIGVSASATLRVFSHQSDAMGFAHELSALLWPGQEITEEPTRKEHLR